MAQKGFMEHRQTENVGRQERCLRRKVIWQEITRPCTKKC